MASSPLADDLFRDQVMRARQSNPWDLFLDGWRLFSESCAWMRAGIQAQNPQLNDQAIELEIQRRLKIQALLEGSRDH